MQPSEAKRQVEQLLGRLDAVKGEINDSKHELDKFSSQHLIVEAREAKADLDRLLVRRKQIELELQRLKKYW